MTPARLSASACLAQCSESAASASGTLIPTAAGRPARALSSAFRRSASTSPGSSRCGSAALKSASASAGTVTAGPIGGATATIVTCCGSFQPTSSARSPIARRGTDGCSRIRRSMRWRHSSCDCGGPGLGAQVAVGRQRGEIVHVAEHVVGELRHHLGRQAVLSAEFDRAPPGDVRADPVGGLQAVQAPALDRLVLAELAADLVAMVGRRARIADQVRRTWPAPGRRPSAAPGRKGRPSGGRTQEWTAGPR